MTVVLHAVNQQNVGRAGISPVQVMQFESLRKVGVRSWSAFGDGAHGDYSEGNFASHDLVVVIAVEATVGLIPRAPYVKVIAGLIEVKCLFT